MSPFACANAFALLILAGCQLANAATTQLPGLIREPFRLAVTLPDGTHAELDALLTRPDGTGRFPLALINHGLPRDPSVIVHMAPENYAGPAIIFAQHGYAAVVVNRRGFGRSSGSYDVTTGPCSDKHYARAGNAWAVDLLAAMTGLQKEPWVDPDRILLVGHSAGAFSALAAATQHPPGLLGIVDFAGGVGSSTPDFVCQPERLIQTMHEFGETVRTPSLWIFAQNDHFFGPTIAQQMFDSYTSAGAPGEFEAAPAIGTDGHLLLFAPPPFWWPRVASFLEKLHLPTTTVVDLPPPTPLPVPPGLDSRGDADFAGYVLSRSYEKAFAIDQNGHYDRVFGQRTQEDAAAIALAHCKQHDWTCSIYAINNTLVASDDAKP